MDRIRAHVGGHRRLAACAVVSATLCSALAVSGQLATAPGAIMRSWPWLLTGLQVTALWAAGGRRWWGWLLGAAVQPPWIVYAVITGQLGFVPGCAISAVVQLRSGTRAGTRGSTHARPSPGTQDGNRSREEQGGIPWPTPIASTAGSSTTRKRLPTSATSSRASSPPSRRISSIA